MEQQDLPIGFSMAIAQNAEALNAFASLDPAARGRMVDQARRASSREEMQRLVDGLTKKR